MIKLKNVEETTQEFLKYAKELKEKQKSVKDTEKIYYSIITFYDALKYDIFIKNFLLHPLVLNDKDFFEEKEYLSTKEEIKNKLKEVIEFELTKDEFLKAEERDKIIKVFNKLKSKDS